AVIEILQIRNELVAIRREARAELYLVVERADASLVGRQQTNQELLRGLTEKRNARRHAAARVEHDDDRDRLRLVVEERNRLELVVVEDVEVVLDEARHESLLRVGDGDEHRHELRPGLERRLLTADGDTAERENASCRRDGTDGKSGH